MIIICLILMTPILLTVIKYRRRSYFFPLHFQHHLSVWGVFCSQGLSGKKSHNLLSTKFYTKFFRIEWPDDSPARLIYICLFLSALVISAAYSGKIVSSRSTSLRQLFDSVEQFANDGTYKLILNQNSVTSEVYQVIDRILTNRDCYTAIFCITSIPFM